MRFLYDARRQLFAIGYALGAPLERRETSGGGAEAIDERDMAPVGELLQICAFTPERI